MSVVENSYPAKVLLFGEYTVLTGGSALAIPFHDFHFKWNQKMTPQHEDPNWSSFLAYLSSSAEELINVVQLKNDLVDGWTLEGDFPIGCGLGSSGAVVAAVADKYGKEGAFSKEPKSLDTCLKNLATLESFFHGASSGTDPLVSYLQQPIIRSKETGVRTISIDQPVPNSPTLVLIDTDLNRESSELVPNFLARYKQNEAFQQSIQSGLLPANQRAIKAFLTGNWSFLLESWKAISRFQHDYFSDMIPDHWYDWWMGAYQSGLVYPKLCGAGGGGFIIGITEDLEVLQRELPQLSMEKITW